MSEQNNVKEAMEAIRAIEELAKDCYTKGVKDCLKCVVIGSVTYMVLYIATDQIKIKLRKAKRNKKRLEEKQ